MLPLSTTRVDLYRPLPGDPETPVAQVPYRTGLPAVVHSQIGIERVDGGQSEDVGGRLDLGIDPGLQHYDRVYDRTTQDWWEVAWVRVRTGLGLTHVEAGLRQVKGSSVG